MKCAIMQPMYMPWSGYFNLISAVDEFIYLDDAQFERGTWHHRNRILLNGEPHFLTIPIRRDRLGDSIAEVVVDPLETVWRRKHCETLRYAYGKSRNWEILAPIMKVIEDKSVTKLVDLSVSITEAICAILSIKTRRRKASEFRLSAGRSQKIIDICRHSACDVYVSPVGAKYYLAEDNFENISGIALEFQNYTPREYSQRNSAEFHSHLSIVDVLMQTGVENTIDYVRYSKA